MKQKAIYRVLFILMILIVTVGVFYADQLDIYNTHSNPIYTSLNTSFKLNINQTAIVEPDNIKITFLNVTEDSRCPEGTVCVWPGQVKALFLLELDQSHEDVFNLTLNSNETQSQKTIAGYSVKLVNVDPYPGSLKTITDNEYAVTLSIKTSI